MPGTPSAVSPPRRAQSRRQEHVGLGNLLPAQLLVDGRQSQDVVVLVHYFFSGVFLVSNADLVVAALISQQIILEGRFRVAALYTGREAGVEVFPNFLVFLSQK